MTAGLNTTSLYDTQGRVVFIYDTQGNLVSGGAGGTTPAPAGTDPATLTSRSKQVATDSLKAPFSQDADATAGTTSFSPFTVLHTATNVRFWLTGPIAGHKAAVTVNGITYELKVNGAGVFDVPGGVDTGVLTDPLPEGIVIEAGTRAVLRRYSPPGQKVWVQKNRAPGAALRVGDFTLTGEVPAESTRGSASTPLAVLGNTTSSARAIYLDGDSMMGPPWARNSATANGLAYTDRAQFALQINWFDPLFGGKFAQGASPWDFFLWELGTNNGGLPQPGSYNSAITAMYKYADAGIKGAQTTLAPRASSTDSWATVENQTPSQHPDWREAWNDWVRDGTPLDTTTRTYVAPGTTGATIKRAGQAGHCLAYPPCDVASAVETTYAANTAQHVWKAGKLTNDGTHYTDAGSLAVEGYVTQWIKTHLAA